MNNQTPIKLEKNTRSLDRKEEALGACWVLNNRAIDPPLSQGPFLFSGKNSKIPTSIAGVISSSTERLLISTQSFSDATIVQATQDAVQRGVRIYMLVDKKGFDAILQNTDCKPLLGHVLLRERQERGLDLVLSDWHLPNKSGVLMNTPLDGTLTHNTGGWAMELSKTQIDEFTVHLQHEFWSITEGREVLAPGEANNPPPIAEAPFTLRSIQNLDHILRAKLVKDGDNSKAEDTLLNEKKWSGLVLNTSKTSSILMNGKSISIGHKSPQVLHASPKNVHPTSSHFAHSMFPMALAFGDGTYLAGWDRTATGEWGSLLLLNAEQKKAAESLFTKYCTAPEWVGYSSIKLGDAGSEILRNEKRLQIVETQTVDLGVVHLSEMPKTKEELTAFEPPLEPPLDSLAKECRFEWMAAPPIVPDSASVDALHQEWAVARNAISERLDELDALNQPSKLPGFDREGKRLQKAIESARESLSHTLEPVAFSKFIEDVEALTESVRGNIKAIRETEYEAEMERLIAEQRQSHAEETRKAKEAVKQLVPRLKKEESNLSKLETALKKASDVEKSRIQSDLSIQSPLVQELKTELDKATETASSEFVFHPPKNSLPHSKSGGIKHRFIGDTTELKISIKVPQEELPATGVLMVDGINRYLSVENWEEVEQGRMDAKRLKATLCAAREVLS